MNRWKFRCEQAENQADYWHKSYKKMRDGARATATELQRVIWEKEHELHTIYDANGCAHQMVTVSAAKEYRIECARRLKAYEKDATVANSRMVCAYCQVSLTNEEIPAHVSTCEQSPLVQKIKDLEEELTLHRATMRKMAEERDHLRENKEDEAVGIEADRQLIASLQAENERMHQNLVEWQDRAIRAEEPAPGSREAKIRQLEEQLQNSFHEAMSIEEARALGVQEEFGRITNLLAKDLYCPYVVVSMEDADKMGSIWLAFNNLCEVLKRPVQS